MSEERRRQANALLGKAWGKVGAPSTVVRFPRPKKRGAKVTRGPCAHILQFPTQLSGEDLDSRFRWMRSVDSDWENEETEGVQPASELDRRLGPHLDAILGYLPPTDTEKRQRIAEGRKLIEKRNSVKDWLKGIGADLDEITTPEQALFFVFDAHAFE